MKADIYPLNPTTLMKDSTTFLPDGYGPVNVILRYEEALPNEGCDVLNTETLSAVGLWDSCVLCRVKHTIEGYYRIKQTVLHCWKYRFDN